MSYVRYTPTISFSNYIDIRSVVGAGNQVINRNYCLRLMTTNSLLPPQSYIEFFTISEVGAYFGTSTIEYARAADYFAFVSKNGNSPNLISFARWVDESVAPYIIGKTSIQSVSLYTSIDDGSFSMTIGGVTNHFTGLDFTSCVNLSDVADVIQTAINTGSGTQWTDATVVWNAAHSSFDFMGGNAVAAQISVSNYSTGTPILALIGWQTGAIIGYGSLSETLTETLQATYSASNNFGSVIFIPDLTLDQDIEIATWVDGLDVEVCYWPRASLDNALTNAAALANFSGVGLTIYDPDEASGISSVTVISGGTYTTNPTVVLSGPGTGAVLIPHLNAKNTSWVTSAPGSGYVTGDTVTLAGGTYLQQAIIKVTTTKLVSFTKSANGTGFVVNDTITFTGGSFSTAAQLTVDTVDGGGGILTAHISVAGSYTVNTNGSSYTTSGSGTGATFTALSFGVNAVTFTDGNQGDYTSLPSNPLSQASTSGAGTGLTGSLSWQIIYFIVLVPGSGFNQSSSISMSGGSINAVVSLVLEDTPTQFAEQSPAMVFAATDYNAGNSVQNYMFQVFNLTPTVTDDATKQSLDQARVNYYGQTQQAGALKAFYQLGVMFGPSDLPTDMNTFTNEIWLKDSIGVAGMNLLLGLANLPANTQGLSLFNSAVQPVLNQALSNGVISAGNTFTPAQIAYITQQSGNPNAWRQVQSTGYWFNPTIVPYTGEDNLQHYKINYVLIYGKNNAVRLVTGKDIQI